MGVRAKCDPLEAKFLLPDAFERVEETSWSRLLAPGQQAALLLKELSSRIASKLNQTKNIQKMCHYHVYAATCVSMPRDSAQEVRASELDVVSDPGPAGQAAWGVHSRAACAATVE